MEGVIEMVHAVYDHLVAILVVGAIFVGAVVVVPSLNYSNLLAVGQQQLRNTALNVFNAMLLDTGYPADWGSQVNGTFYFHSDAVKRFGLASATDSTFYLLDPDKVLRLDEANPLGSLSYEEMRGLLGLQNYGFSFRIIPPFNVTNADGTKIDSDHTPIKFVDPPTNSTLQYAVRISYLDGSPVPNAIIEATVVYTKGEDFNIAILDPAPTNALGTCEKQVLLSLSNPDYVIVILRITVAQVSSILVTFGKDASVYVADINLVGDSVILTKAKDPSNEDVKINEIFVYGSSGELFSLYNGTTDDHFNTGKGQHTLWNKAFDGLSEYDPTILIFNFEAVEGGRKEIVVAGPYQNLLGYTIFEYGSPVGSASAAVRLQRIVLISSMTYTVELWLWKESP